MLKNLIIGKKNQTSNITKEKKEAPQKAEQVDMTEGDTLEKSTPPHHQKNPSDQLSESLSEEGLHTSTDEIPNHFDDLIDGEQAGEQATHTAQIKSGMLSLNDFHTLFCGGFSAASHMTGLKSMAVDASDGGAIACTGALYDTILDIPMLHFLLNPNNKWFERIIVIGAFTAPMAAGVSVELKARKKPKGGELNGQPADGGGSPPSNDLSGVKSLKDLAKEQA